MRAPALRLVVALALLSLPAPSAHAKDCRGETPLPADHAVVHAAPGVPPEIAAFLGEWSGTWTARGQEWECAVLVVQEVYANGYARGVYSVGMKALDFGAYGILVPLINTAEDAAKAVAACRYPPVGMRSSGPVRAVHYGGPDYVAKANDEIVVMGMVETKEGLANLDAICATPGLDAIYIGPSDLAFAIGMNPRPDNPDPVHMATCDKIRDTAHKHGKKACMHCASGTFAAGAVKRGYDLVMVTSDLASMMAGVKKHLDDLKTATA